MKYRNGFVSNSSSSSFILFKDYLTKEQIEHIKNWKTFAVSDEFKKMLKEYAEEHSVEDHVDVTIDWKDPKQEKRVAVENFSLDDYPYYPEGWTVQETNSTFEIGTFMDNFNMEQFLAVLGVDVDKTGLRLEDHHSAIIGRNDAKSDIRDYVNDPYFFENYEEDYWLTSRFYREKIYKPVVETNKKILEIKPDAYVPWPREPLKKKTWICEDAGHALNEVESKIKDLAAKNGVYTFGKPSEDQIEKYRIYNEIVETIKRVKDNWRTVDEFESSKTEDIDESQLVIANIENEGYLSEEDEKKYNEEINKLYKPLGVNVNNL